ERLGHVERPITATHGDVTTRSRDRCRCFRYHHRSLCVGTRSISGNGVHESARRMCDGVVIGGYGTTVLRPYTAGTGRTRQVIDQRGGTAIAAEIRGPISTGVRGLRYIHRN